MNTTLFIFNAMSTLKAIELICGSLTAFGAFLLSVHRWILKPLFLKVSKDMLEAVNVRLDTQDDHLKRIGDVVERELKPNGGYSLKDQVVQTNLTVKKIEAKQAAYGKLTETASFEFDTTGGCIEANRELCDLLECHKDELLGDGWLRYIKQSDKARVKEEWTDSLKSGFELLSNFGILTGERGTEVNIRLYIVISREGNSVNGKIIAISGKMKELQTKTSSI